MKPASSQHPENGQRLAANAVHPPGIAATLPSPASSFRIPSKPRRPRKWSSRSGRQHSEVLVGWRDFGSVRWRAAQQPPKLPIVCLPNSREIFFSDVASLWFWLSFIAPAGLRLHSALGNRSPEEFEQQIEASGSAESLSATMVFFENKENSGKISKGLLGKELIWMERATGMEPKFGALERTTFGSMDWSASYQTKSFGTSWVIDAWQLLNKDLRRN
jgi:hypothetical protein